MANSLLVDQFDRPVHSGMYIYGGGGRFLGAANRGGGDRPYEAVTLDSINRLIPPNDWQATVAISTKLVANLDVVKGALWSKAMYSAGRAFLPEFEGEAKEWGKATTRWLKDTFYSIGNINGDPTHDLRTDLQIGSVRIDAASGFFVPLTEYEGGFPAYQCIPIWRLWNGGAVSTVDTLQTAKNPDGSKINNGEVETLKLAKPLCIYNGVIYNPVGMRKLYFRFRRESADNPLGLSQEYVDIHANDLIHCYDPEEHESLLGLPSLSASVNPLRDSLTSREFEQIAMMAHSALVFVEENEKGAPPDDLLPPVPGSDPAIGRTVQEQRMMGGMARFFKAGSGGKITAFNSQRPGDSWEAIQDRIIRAAMRGMNWSPMLAWGKDNPGGQVARADIDQCNASVKDRQDLLRYVATRIIGYAVSKAIKIGALRPYPGTDIGGQLKWKVSVPGQISIDDGRDRNNDREDYKIGIDLKSNIYARRGFGDFDAFMYARAREAGRMEQIRLEVSKEMKVEIPARAMEMLSPNEQPDGQDGTENSNKVATAKDPNDEE